VDDIIVLSCTLSYRVCDEVMQGRTITAICSVTVVAIISLLTVLTPGTALFAAPEIASGPRLLGVSPAPAGVAGRDAVVALSFDRPMDLESLSDAVCFEPPLSFRVSGEAECLVVPVNLLQPGTQYSFHLGPGRARDLEGRPFDKELDVAFSTRGDGMILEIPAMSYSGPIIEGKDPQGVTSIIGFGAGHYPGTGRPGCGNLVLMAHASGQIEFPFNRLRELSKGDEMKVEYGGRTYVYGWGEGLVVPDTAVWILDHTPYAELTVFVCCAADGKPSPTFHPPYRYVVRAPLNGVSPGHGT
jgi:LPXTG-site transpeptidase (sortase) family protein